MLVTIPTQVIHISTNRVTLFISFEPDVNL